MQNYTIFIFVLKPVVLGCRAGNFAARHHHHHHHHSPLTSIVPIGWVHNFYVRWFYLTSFHFGDLHPGLLAHIVTSRWNISFTRFFIIWSDQIIPRKEVSMFSAVTMHTMIRWFEICDGELSCADIIPRICFTSVCHHYWQHQPRF